MMGQIARIQRFSTTNGPGLRSTVFLKGCPLRCLWCHNPEMQSFKKELMVYKEPCALCGSCERVCENGGHRIEDGRHLVSREHCVLCGKCLESCPKAAIELVGEQIEATEVVKRLMRDRIFYTSGKGGITLSGGEPLAQFEFVREILTLCKAEGLHTCLDTSGWGGRAQELAGLVDLYLWDIKETDAQRHREVTGVELEPILDSLKQVDAAGGKMYIRCPIIPGVNDREEHIRAIGELVNSLNGVQRIDLVPYHRLGLPKADALGMQQEEFSALTAEKKEAFLQLLKGVTEVSTQWI